MILNLFRELKLGHWLRDEVSIIIITVDIFKLGTILTKNL